jgi:hypothetical protein
MNDSLLIIKTAQRRYAVQRDDLMEIKLVANPADLQVSGQFDRPCVGVELGPLLDPSDHSTLKRQRALVVPMRRRYVALLVDYIETFLERASTTPLPALLREKLRQPWAVGALLLEDELIVEIDLRAVARSALMVRPSERES